MCNALGTSLTDLTTFRPFLQNSSNKYASPSLSLLLSYPSSFPPHLFPTPPWRDPEIQLGGWEHCKFPPIDSGVKLRKLCFWCMLNFVTSQEASGDRSNNYRNLKKKFFSQIFVKMQASQAKFSESVGPKTLTGTTPMNVSVTFLFNLMPIIYNGFSQLW